MPATPSRRATALAPTSRKLPTTVQRRLAFAALGLAVWLGHRWLLDGLGAWVVRPAATPAASAPVAVWLVPPAAPQSTTAIQAPQATVAPRVAPPGTRAAPLTLPRVATAPTTATLDRTTPARADQTSSAPITVAQGPTASAPSAPATPPSATADDGAAAAPPTYPTRLPPPVRLRFVVQRGDQQGEAQWLWQHNGQQFVSQLQSALPGRTALDHQTRGEFDAAGLAPLRMLESQRGRAVRAVNFQRDKGVVSFSGSSRQWALWPGAQDRASWLPQLLAVVAGRSGWAPGQQVELAVASPRGELDRWAFTLADTDGPGGDGPPSALHWVRQPLRPYDSRVDLWLQPAAPHWPLALQWQVLPGGEPLRWRLLPDGTSVPPAP